MSQNLRIVIQAADGIFADNTLPMTDVILSFSRFVHHSPVAAVARFGPAL